MNTLTIYSVILIQPGAVSPLAFAESLSRGEQVYAAHLPGYALTARIQLVAFPVDKEKFLNFELGEDEDNKRAYLENALQQAGPGLSILKDSAA